MCTRPDTGHGTGPQVEVADILRTHGAAYQQRYHLSGGQRRVMQDIMACRTAALGGQLAQCDHCSAQVIRYHSCQNRHCPKCQTLAKVHWVEARLRDLLPIPYFHCVFTLPHTLNPLAQGNPRILYGLLFQTAAATLQTFGRDPTWLGGELGITMVLHT
jgi:Transposase zinc-binding domain